jgi:signal transduction histidine kinase
MNATLELPPLTQLLQEHRDVIIGEWANHVHNIPDSTYQSYPLTDVAQWSAEGLDAIIESIASGSTQTLEGYLREIVFSRLQEGFSIYEVTEALLLAKEAITPSIFNAYPGGSPEALAATQQLDSCLRYMVSYFGLLFSETMHDQLLEETNQRLVESESIKRTMTALLQKLTLDEVLEIVCSEARQLTNASGTAVLLLEEEWLQVTFSIGRPKPALDRLPVAQSLAGIAVQRGQPLLVNDPTKQIQAYHRNPNLQSLLVVPLFIEGTSIGVIDVVNKPGGFEDDDIRILNLFATQAAIAIKSARLRQQAGQLALVNERQRLARDLHDSVTQLMYGISLFADASQKALAGNKIEKAIENLGELRKMTREAMLEMRLLVFELHPPILEEEGLVTALQTRLDSVEARSGIHTEYHVVGERRLPLEIESELYRIAQEALTNVVKHAKADEISLTLNFKKGRFQLIIEDNGIGFDPGDADKGRGMGLRGMQERVQRLNGILNIDSTKDDGTIIQVTVEV